MSDDNAIEIAKRAEKMFSRREGSGLMNLWQEEALHFCPWDAEFTTDLIWGEDYASHLTENTPLLLARELAGQVGSMLRPVGKQWGKLRTGHESLNSERTVRAALDWRSEQMFRILFDRVTGFGRAANYADRFFSVFGNAVLSIDLSVMQDSLRVGAYHLKDVVWADDDEGKPNKVKRREKLSARNMRRRFPRAKLDQRVLEALDKDPDQEFTCLHCVMPADEYEYYNKGMRRASGRFASVWIDADHNTILREAPQRTFRYVIPRWSRIPGRPYAFSPASIVALPDARLIQAQALVLLEAGEKSAAPPVVAITEAIRGGVNLDANGVTYVDKNYDHKTGKPVEPLDLGKNVPIALDVIMRTEAQLTRAFYLDVLRMPDTTRTKSIPEVQFLIDQYIRSALPLFAPIETEYNANLLHEAYEIIELAGGFAEGPEWPEALRGQEMQFQWDNPLQEMLERQKSQKVAEVGLLAQSISQVEQLKQASPALAQTNTTKMYRDAFLGLGEAGWLLDEAESAAAMEQQDQAAQAQNMLVNSKNISSLIDSGVNAAQAAAEIPNPAEPAYPVLPAPG